MATGGNDAAAAGGHLLERLRALPKRHRSTAPTSRSGASNALINARPALATSGSRLTTAGCGRRGKGGVNGAEGRSTVRETWRSGVDRSSTALCVTGGTAIRGKARKATSATTLKRPRRRHSGAGACLTTGGSSTSGATSGAGLTTGFAFVASPSGLRGGDGEPRLRRRFVADAAWARRTAAAGGVVGEPTDSKAVAHEARVLVLLAVLARQPVERRRDMGVGLALVETDAEHRSYGRARRCRSAGLSGPCRRAVAAPRAV